jgi:hypothetical protein
MSMVALITVVDKCVTRSQRRKAAKQADLGPTNDPIRQQGRDPLHFYCRPRWYATTQACDRSRHSRRQRLYHDSYRTSSGHTWDQLFEELAELAVPFEIAGIDLGWGCAPKPGDTRIHGSVAQEVDRRYLEPRPNQFALKQITRRTQKARVA